MKTHQHFVIATRLVIVVALTLFTLTGIASAQNRRAPVPDVSAEQIRGIFFENLSDAFQGERPTLSSIRSASKAAQTTAIANQSKSNSGGDSGSDLWTTLISAASIEDEIKQVRLRYDALITTPGRFNSGGYLSARLELTILATLFGVIAEYGEQVRWKSHADAARDLLGRTASNCKAGSTQVYNEAKLRKGDLRDLVSGTGLAGRRGEPTEDWSGVADRSPLMEYAEMLIEKLEDDGRDAKTIQSNQSDIRRRAELLAMLGHVLTKDGIDGSGDEDYDELSHSMSDAARNVVMALERTDFENVRQGISTIRSRCDACHAEYR
ncbi:hypothetical protein LF1_01880 [Rubripirellula obstinata]|uniref:Cytochrome C n=1 Tax=Rubripirellula obstinata TaxID=406547 RepID=A0A5B1CDN1_9BACT|nr:cytochrome c [Rubripirellula obstinata]KAA1257700.1 hypothetical protein LF1_01880 [Rubripirellula obstinata]